jgi:hypothetical protein
VYTIYAERAPQIDEELEGKTLSDFEDERGINALNYTGVGFGYNLKKYYPKTREEARKTLENPEWDDYLSSIQEPA